MKLYGELLYMLILQTIQLHYFHGVRDTLFTRDIVHKLMKEAEKAVCQEMKCRHTTGNNCDIYYD